METMHRTGQIDPSALLMLPESMLRMHMAHTLNHITGQYDPPLDQKDSPEKKGGKGRISAARAVMAHHQQRTDGPTTADLEGARWVLEQGDAFPAQAQRDALETLKRAGRL